MPLVTFIIPHRNNFSLLKSCLSSLREQTCDDYEIIIVDNGSRDGSPQKLRRHFPEVRLISLPTNSGFARAANLGIRASRSPFLAFLNNDVEISPSWLERMLEGVSSDPGLGAGAGKLLQKGRASRLSSIGNLVFKSGFGRDRGWGEADGEKASHREKIFWASGAACLIPRRLFSEVGEWDEDFFAYFEDIDLGLRAQLRGFSCMYIPGAIGYHVEGATGRDLPRLGAALRFRNALMLVIKDFPAPLIAENLHYIVFAHLRAIVYLILTGHARQVLSSEYFLFRNFPRLLRKRRLIQDARTVPIERIRALLSPEDFSRAGIRSWFQSLKKYPAGARGAGSPRAIKSFPGG